MNNELTKMAADVANGKTSRRAFLGKASALGVGATMASTMLATAAQAEGAIKGGHLVMGMVGGESTNTLDPALAATQVPAATLRMMGNQLVTTNPAGELTMELAESVESNAEATQWMFKIRKGVEFHSGKTLTPDDVLKTLQRHSDEASTSAALGIMQGISNMKVDGDYVVVETAVANADLPFLMTDYHLVIQPNGGMDNPTVADGTGAYKIVEDQPGVRHTFEKFANHWNPDVGHYDSTEILVINDSTARSSALQSGQVHMINRVEPKIADLMKNAPGMAVETASGPGHYGFMMHVNTAPFDNNELTLALKYAINRQEMVDKILRGYGSVGNDMPINGAYPLFDDSIEQREYDPAKAAEHYANSGHDGSPIILRVADAAFPGAIDAAQLFQASAAAAGIPLEIKREPDDGYWSEVWNVQPFCASYWGGRPVQDQMYSTAYLSTADWNDTRFFSDEFDALLLQARSELDTDKRKAIYGQMGRMIRDTGGLICPMFNDFVDARSDKVMGWVANPRDEMMNRQAPLQTWFKA